MHLLVLITEEREKVYLWHNCCFFESNIQIYPIMRPVKSLRYTLLLCAAFLLLQAKAFAGNSTTQEKQPQADSIKIELAMVLDPRPSGEMRYYSLSDWNMYEGDVDLDIAYKNYPKIIKGGYFNGYNS